MIRTSLKVALLAGVAVAGLAWFAPGPFASVQGWIAGLAGFTPASCAAAPVACFDARERNLQAALAKLRDGGAQAEAGLHAIDAAVARQRELLDANTGLQTILRTRAAEMVRTGASGLTFQGKDYTRAEVEQQAELLVREEAGFRSTIAGFEGRRAGLTEARMSAVVEGNRVSGTLATLAAERAMVVATGSLEGARQLLDDSKQTEARARDVSDAVVRSTREMAELTPAAPAAAHGPTFEFSSWMAGQSGAPAPAN